MTFTYWIKFQTNNRPDRFSYKTFEEFWHELREFMLRNNTGPIEWMIRD